jgi:hypothetical protein
MLKQTSCALVLCGLAFAGAFRGLRADRVFMQRGAGANRALKP